MIVVQISVHPSGDPINSREIARMSIGNISDMSEISNYIVFATEDKNPLTHKPARRTTTEVKDHHRTQSVWALIAKAAQKAATNFNGEAAKPCP